MILKVVQVKWKAGAGNDLGKADSERRLIGSGCLAKGGIRKVESEPVLSELLEPAAHRNPMASSPSADF